MKVIGFTGDNKYLCEVSHDEIERLLNLYYGKRERLKANEEIDLGRGYDFARDIADSMKQTREFVGSHQKIISAIVKGLSLESIEIAAKEQPHDRI